MEKIMNSFINEIIKQFKQEFAPFVWLFGRDQSVDDLKDSELEGIETKRPAIENKMHELIYIWCRAALFCAIFYFWFAQWIGKLLDMDETPTSYTGIALTLGLALSQTIYLLRARKK